MIDLRYDNIAPIDDELARAVYEGFYGLWPRRPLTAQRPIVRICPRCGERFLTWSYRQNPGATYCIGCVKYET